MGEAKRKRAKVAGTTDDPAFQRAVFAQAFEQTRKLLDDPQIETLEALTLAYGVRNEGLDQAARIHAAAGKAECRIGCASCCHQMVLCSPFEVFAIARYLLETKTPAEIGAIRERLAWLSRLPLDPAVRLDAQYPCALLENDRCIVYEERPSLCRTMLSASRAACEACLASKAGTIPYLADAAKTAALMQLGIDHAAATRRNLSTERVELSRALAIALDGYDAALTRWLKGDAPFPDGEIRPAGFPSNRELAQAAAKRFGAP
jgi:hypothetical protein